MGITSYYYAAKDVENEQGVIDWDQVPIRNGGKLDTGNPEDKE